MPDIQINIMTVLLATVASFFFGFLWFSVLFKKSWAIEMGYDPNEEPPKAVLFKSLGLSILGSFLMAFVLSHQVAVWNPETWGISVEISKISHVTQAAFFTWLGFFVPMHLNGVAWEKKSWKLFIINASFHFIVLFIMASILIFV